MKFVFYWSVMTVAFTAVIIGFLKVSDYNDEGLDKIKIELKEMSRDQYPEDPAPMSVNYRRYANRELTLVRKKNFIYDFILSSKDEDVATITFKNIDLKLFIPNIPFWVKGNIDHGIISLVDREWNRQQVKFRPYSSHIEISGGDGYEKKHISQLALARNCLNGGLWEIILVDKNNSKSGMYYQAWFDFPKGHYKKIFESLNQVSYWDHWFRLEHWWDPEGTPIHLDELRTVKREIKSKIRFNPSEKIIVRGEQIRKNRTTQSQSLRTWGDFVDPNREIAFATFRPPGFYDHDKPWSNKYWKIAKFEGAEVREIRSPAAKGKFHEIELRYRDRKTDQINKIIIGGVNLRTLPRLQMKNYPKGLYMPMGIGVGPFYQFYESLKKKNPVNTPYYSFMLNQKNQWLDHHSIAIDGPVMHRDVRKSNRIHLYLLSYERHSLVAHYTIDLLN